MMKFGTWNTLAASILKAELAKRDMKYIDLEKKLNEIGKKYNYDMIKILLNFVGKSKI